MANAFDQFDAPSAGNPFDQFDPQSAVTPSPSSLARRALGDTAVSLGKGVVGAGESAVGLADLATGGYAGKALNKLTGYDPKATKAALDDLYSPEQKAANKAVQDADGFVPTLGALAKNPSAIVQGVAESAPSIIGAGGGAQAIGKAGILAKNALARGAIGEGLVGAGQQAEQFRQDNPDGTLSARQELAALASGAGTAAFAGLGGKVAQKLGISDLDTMLAGGAAPAAAAKQVARRVGEGFVSEGALEEMPQSIWEQATQNFGNGKALSEGVGNAAATGLVVGGVMGGGTNLLSRQPNAAPAPPPLGAPTDGAIPYTPTTVEEVARQRAEAMGIKPENGPLSVASGMAIEGQTAEEMRLATPGILAQGAAAAEQARIAQEARQAAEPGIPYDPVAVEAPQAAPTTPRARDTVPPPSGSFSQMDELAQLVGQEKADKDSRLADIASRQQAAQSAADAYREERLAEIDQTVADNRQRQTETARLDLLHGILSDAEVANPAEKFSAELARQGYRNTAATPQESAAIQRHGELKQAFAGWQNPATQGPKEGFKKVQDSADFYDLLGREKADLEQRRAALQKPAPAPQPKDKHQAVADLVAAGATMKGRDLVSPTGKVVMKNLNLMQAAKARQFIRERNTNPTPPNAQTAETPAPAQAVQTEAQGSQQQPAPESDAGNGFKHGPQAGERYRVGQVSSVGGAIALEKRLPAGTNATFYVGVDGILIDGDSLNLISNESRSRLWIPANSEQASQALHVLDEMGRLALSDPRRAEMKRQLKSLVTNSAQPTQVPGESDPREAYANQKAEAYIAQRGGNAPPKAVEVVRIGARKEFDKAQGAETSNEEPTVEAIDVSTRTDDQLRYLASNGKPGWKEAAQAEMARREGAKPAEPDSGLPDTRAGGSGGLVAKRPTPSKPEGSSIDRAVRTLMDRTNGNGSPDGLIGPENQDARAEIISALTGKPAESLSVLEKSLSAMETQLHRAAGITEGSIKERRSRFIDWIDSRSAGAEESDAPPANQNPIKTETRANTGPEAEVASANKETRMTSQEWRDKGKSPVDLIEEKADYLGRQLAMTIAEEASQKDFAPNELATAVRMWADDGKVPADSLRIATLKHVSDFGLSDGRIKQIRAALNPLNAKNQEPTKLSVDLESLFADLDSSTVRKANKAKKAAKAHPLADKIQNVQDNFLDILQELEDSGKVKINC